MNIPLEESFILSEVTLVVAVPAKDGDLSPTPLEYVVAAIESDPRITGMFHKEKLLTLEPASEEHTDAN